MKATGKGPLHTAWRLVRALAKSFLHCAYSGLVLLLAAVTVFAAYVAYRQTIPVPPFILREIRDTFAKQGLAIHLQAVTLRPNGLVTILQPEVRSNELGSAIARAKILQAKINLPSLLVGRVAFDSVAIADGSLDLPPLLTPSGLPETAVDSINLHASRKRGLWRFHYANFAIEELKVSLDGPVRERLLAPPRGKKPAAPPNIAQTIANLAPKLFELRRQIARFSQPSCSIRLGQDPERRQTAQVTLLFDAARLRPDASTGPGIASVGYHETAGIQLHASLSHIALPQKSSARSLLVHADWPAIPSPAAWRPRRAQLAAANATFREFPIPSLILDLAPTPDSWTARAEIDLLDSPLSLHLQRDDHTRQTHFQAKAELSPRIPQGLAALVATFVPVDLPKVSRIDRPATIELSGALDAAFKPQRIDLAAQTSSLAILGAEIERARATGKIVGPQIDLDSIRIRAGVQSAQIGVHFNLQTLARRILVEGNVDPTLINGWFKPWWSAMWDGMAFSPTGLYVAMDSRGTHLQPTSARVTGIGRARDMDLRGIPVEELRLRFFSLFHYVDLYDIELAAKTGEAANGEAQFALARDFRDSKDKLAALWIDAESTLDLMRGPAALPEIGVAVARILAPYSYDKIPKINARSSSIRHKDTFLYDIDLDIQTDAPFRFYGFPFDSLDTFVHLQNGIADIPNARASLAGGQLAASAFILGDGIQIDVDVTGAGFGQTLLAANTYFATNGSESAAANPPEKFLELAGTLDATFAGKGLLGDPLGYRGAGYLQVSNANLVEKRLLGPLSAALEATPLFFTTLKFDSLEGPFAVDGRYVKVADTELDGPVAKLRLEGLYDLGTEEMDLKARLFPFLNSNIPILSAIINIATQPISSVIELSIRGPFDDPKISIFSGSSGDGPSADPRTHRPSPR